MAVSLGFASDAIVQEFYVDDDVDQAVREAIEGETGHPLVDVDYADVVDGAIVWWRADDAEEEDLADVLVDAPQLRARGRRGGGCGDRGPACDDLDGAGR